MTRLRVLASILIVLLVALPTGIGQGQRVEFPLVKYNDTLFANVDTAYRAVFDASGDVWYSTTSGIVHLNLQDGSRKLFTHQDGLPSSLGLGLAASGAKVYAGTDLGLGVIDRATGTVRPVTPLNSPLPDDIVHEVAVDGADVWLGTHFGGVARWNTTSDHWTIQNTSTSNDYAKPVRRIVPTPTAVWVGTDGDGVWKFDRATQNWTVTLKGNDTGLPSNTVLSILERGADVYFGTDAGIAVKTGGGSWRLYNKTNGMPDDRAYDLDSIPTVDGGHDVFAATRQGLWQLHPETGNNTVRDQNFGILGSLIFDETYTDDHGWVFATSRGVSLLRDSGWTYYATGPSNGASPGPVSYRFTAAYAGPDTPYVWAGSDSGVSAFYPAHVNSTGALAPGRWYNLGEWQRYPGGPINAIKVQGNTTWLATNTGTFGFDAQANAWRSRQVVGSRNLVYGIDTDANELWIALFGDGLVMQNITSGETRNWTYEHGAIPDQNVLDVRLTPSTAWIASSVGVTKLDRVSGAFKGTYTAADGIPGSGIVFRVLPEGASTVWVGTKDGGVGKLDVLQGRVVRTWNASNTAGFPKEEVRSLLRVGGDLFAGTKGGLAQIDVASGEVHVYNQSNSKLVQEFVSGLAEKDGILYLATASGVARFDIATRTFLPMSDASDAQHSAGTGSTPTTYVAPVNVHIDAPHDSVGVTGSVVIHGSANRLGSPVDRVEVRIGTGPWQAATGTDAWTFTWDSTTSTPDQPVTIAARAWSGTDVSREATVLVTPVKLPTIPLKLTHTAITSASAGRPLLVGAQVTGDEPVSATLYYKTPGRDAYASLGMARQGSLFTATIPGKDVLQGSLLYYIVGKSGLLETTSPDDITSPHAVEVGPPARVAVALEGPKDLVAKAGVATSFRLNVSNVGTDPATFQITASGLRAPWVHVTAEAITLGPGETRAINASIDVPLRAFDDNTTLTFDVKDTSGTAESAEASVPVRIVAADIATLPPPDTSTPAKPVPSAALPLALAVALAIALATRRRRS